MAGAKNVEVRRRLMQIIADTIKGRALKQREAAELFRTTQPRISEVVRGRAAEFTIDSLVNMLAAADLCASVTWTTDATEPPHVTTADPVTGAYLADVDRTLIREALRRTPTERVMALADLQSLAAEARAGRSGPHLER